MTYSQAIKSGFRLINSRWQLVAVQAGMMVVNCIGFFILVGIPLGIAFVIFGLDLSSLTQTKDLLAFFQHPAGLLSKYFGLVIIVVTSVLLYLTVATTLWLYVLGGTSGFISSCIVDPARKFSMRAFFAEAKRLFFPLMWFSLVVLLAFIGIAFVLGLLGGGIAAIVSAVKGQNSTFALFLATFFSLALALAGLVLIVGTLAATVYGIAVLSFRKEGAIASFNSAVKFLWKKPGGLWLYVLLVIGYVAVSFAVMLVIYPLNLIPFVGPIVSLPLQIISYVFQGYLGLVIFAAVFNYYYDAEIGVAVAPAAQAPQPPHDVTAESSTPGENISIPEAPQPGPLPPEKEEKEED